jgi:hypothetical protein
MTDLHQAEKVMSSAEAERPLYTFTVGERLARQTGIKTLALIELKSSEEVMATKRAQAAGGQIALAVELVKESLRRVNGTPLSTGDGSVDTWWAKASPGFSKVRQMAMAAYMEIHNPSPEDSEGFLSSMSVSVG